MKVDRYEIGSGRLGNDPSQSCFAGSGWSREERYRFNGPSQQMPYAYKVILAYKLVEGLRALAAGSTGKSVTAAVQPKA